MYILKGEGKKGRHFRPGEKKNYVFLFSRVSTRVDAVVERSKCRSKMHSKQGVASSSPTSARDKNEFIFDRLKLKIINKNLKCNK